MHPFISCQGAREGRHQERQCAPCIHCIHPPDPVILERSQHQIPEHLAYADAWSVSSGTSVHRQVLLEHKEN